MSQIGDDESSTAPSPLYTHIDISSTWNVDCSTASLDCCCCCCSMWCCLLLGYSWCCCKPRRTDIWFRMMKRNAQSYTANIFWCNKQISHQTSKEEDIQLIECMLEWTGPSFHPPPPPPHQQQQVIKFVFILSLLLLLLWSSSANENSTRHLRI